MQMHCSGVRSYLIRSSLSLSSSIITFTKSWLAQGPFLASYTPVSSHPVSYGIRRVDHAVGNVPVMHETIDYIKRFSGFHEFAEFTAEVSSSTWTLLV